MNSDNSESDKYDQQIYECCYCKSIVRYHSRIKSVVEIRTQSWASCKIITVENLQSGKILNKVTSVKYCDKHRHVGIYVLYCVPKLLLTNYHYEGGKKYCRRCEVYSIMTVSSSNTILNFEDITSTT